MVHTFAALGIDADNGRLKLLISSDDEQQDVNTQFWNRLYMYTGDQFRSFPVIITDNVIHSHLNGTELIL